MWLFSRNRKESMNKKDHIDTYCDQMASHVREVLKYKILMDDATNRLLEINRDTPYECKDYARLIEKSNKAHNDSETYLYNWSHHISILSMLILPHISVIVDVDGIKYKVTNIEGKLGYFINIEEILKEKMV